MASNDDNGPWGKPLRPGGYSNRPSGPPAGSPNDLFQKGQEHFNRFFSGDHGRKKLAGIAALAILLLWLASGFYQVQPSQQGVVLRFGQFSRTTGAGLRYHLPAPFETAYVIDTQLVRRESFGPQAGTPSEGLSDNLMLTGDENIIEITFDVQWNIKDPRAFLFNVRDPVTTVRGAAESAMREIIGQTAFTVAQTGGKSRIEQDTKALIQQTLDNYKAGIRIQTVNLLESSAPGPVVGAVRDVQAARADEERSRNEAQSYSNDIIPKARGQAEKMIQEAEAYKQEVVARAQGDTARFIAVYEQYIRAQDVTKKRMYLETMETIFKGMNKVILENKGGAVPYFPIPAPAQPVPKEGAVP